MANGQLIGMDTDTIIKDVLNKITRGNENEFK